jgi:DNA-binding NarL/FixJ family response regulator
VLAASLHSTRQPVESMFKAGAMGFLPKTLMKLYLKNAVESLANNEVFIYDPGILTNDDINYLKFIRDPRCRKCV